MNIQELRQSLKLKWVNYYAKNCSWLEEMRVWGTYDGQRRPSSGFILATLSVLEPQLDQILPFIIELNNNPDHIVAALGLNFDPKDELHLVQPDDLSDNSNTTNGKVGSNQSSPQPTDAAIATDSIKSNSQSDTSVQFAVKLKPSSQPASHHQSQQPIVGFLELESQASHGKPSLVIAIKPKSLSHHHKSLASVGVSAERSNHHQLGLSLSLNSAEERKSHSCLVPTLVQNRHSQNNNSKTRLSPAPPTGKLASWIDSFCQGVGWERQETISHRC